MSLGVCRFSGQKGEQRPAAAVASSASRDRPGNDVDVRGDRVPDLQYSAYDLKCA